MTTSIDIFDYLNDAWDLLPQSDRDRFGELWKAYEQSYGSVYARLFDRSISSSVDFVGLHDHQRWLRYIFDETTRLTIPATFLSTQDLSRPLNLSVKYLLRFSIDGQLPVEIDLRGANPEHTTATEIVHKINQAAGFSFASLERLGALLRLRTRTSGETSFIEFYPASRPENDAVEAIVGISRTSLPTTYPKFRYSYRLPDTSTARIPKLQDKIHPEQVESYLTEGIDYELTDGTGVIYFREPPAREAYWAETTLLNLETAYNNFGYLLDIYDKNSDSYLKAVRGLWFAFWTGPKPENIRRSLYLLFGLPTSSKDGTVSSVTDEFIDLRYADGTEERFSIPIGLVSEVVTGQGVSRFQPLVSGIRVYDKLNSPGFLEREIGRPAVFQFLTELAKRGAGPKTDETLALKLLEQNTYLPQIDVNAFISPDIRLSNVKTFLSNIQPKSRTFLFQILVGSFKDTLSASEEIALDISVRVHPTIDYNPSLEIQQEDRVLTETDPLTANILDSEAVGFSEYAEIEIRTGNELLSVVI